VASRTIHIRHPLCAVTIRARRDLDTDVIRDLILQSLDNHVVWRPRGRDRRGRARQPGRDGADRGTLVREHRKRLGLTQAEVALRSGIRQNHLSEMENNKRPIGRRNARRLSRVLGLDYRLLV
jgi:DNA-binding XRE family transcriptional regulator